MNAISPTLSNCSICLNKVKADRYVSIEHEQNNARHYFHIRCLLDWMENINQASHTQCPNCMQKMEKFSFSNDAHETLFYKWLNSRIELIKTRTKMASMLQNLPALPQPTPQPPPPAPTSCCSIQ